MELFSFIFPKNELLYITLRLTYCISYKIKIQKGDFEIMRKILALTALFTAAAFCSVNLAIAEPAASPDTPKCKQPPRQERILPRPCLEDILLGNTALNLTEKQKKDIEKTSKATQKKVRKLDKKIRDAQEEKLFTISDHFKKLQTILTDEQKEILYQEHQKRVAEKMAKIKEIQKNKPKCECKEKCNCAPKKPGAIRHGKKGVSQCPAKKTVQPQQSVKK